jgi:hypothetical protein
MDSLNISWRGGSGTGKRTQLVRGLEQIARIRGIPFTLQKRLFHVQNSKGDGTEISTTADEDDDVGSVTEKNALPYEFSYIHVGFDIARMSMQDKIYLRPILQRWGIGSQVLAGNQGRGSRILVFYHAHLLSTESCFLLHSLLEECGRDVSVWFTSEMPIPLRLSDYFLEVPVSGRDQALEKYKMSMSVPNLPTWADIFRLKLLDWSRKGPPILSETTQIRAFLYECLMRNLRWVEAIHIILDVLLTLPIPEEKRLKALDVLARQEATAAGQTIPSYRIPLLWEMMFLNLRESLSSATVENEPSMGLTRMCDSSPAAVPINTVTVAKRQPAARRRGGVQKADG